MNFVLLIGLCFTLIPCGHSVSNQITAPTGAGKWTYAETVGKTGEKVYTASLTSADVLNFDAPANGGSTVTLTLQHRNGTTTVSLAVSKGQFTSSFQGGNVRISFDKDPPATYAYSAAANGATNIIFFDTVEPLITRLKRSRSISVGFLQPGRSAGRLHHVRPAVETLILLFTKVFPCFLPFTCRSPIRRVTIADELIDAIKKASLKIR